MARREDRPDRDDDDTPLFADLDEPAFADDDVVLPPPHVGWGRAFLVSFGATVAMLAVLLALIGGLDLEAREDGGGDEGVLLLLTAGVVLLHAALLKYGLRAIAGYHVGFTWALLAAALAYVLVTLDIAGLVLSLPIQAAIVRFRSEPLPSLVHRT